MGPNQTESISMGPIWNTGSRPTEMVIIVPVLGPQWASWVRNGLYSVLPPLGETGAQWLTGHSESVAI